MKITKNKKGFTLAEIMATIGITVILLAIGSLGVVSIQRGLNQTNADAMARQIFVTAQENLTKLKTAGNSSEIGPGPELGYLPTGAPENTKNLHYINNETDDIELLVPKGLSIDYENDSYVIEYDPDLGIVTGVFYGTTDNYKNYYDKATANTLRDREARLELHDKEKFYVGYYGDGYTDITDNKNVKNLNGRISISNKDTLTATFTVEATNGIDSKAAINLDIVYRGVDSGMMMVENTTVTLNEHKASVTYLLDSLVEKRDFDFLFNHTSNVPDEFKVGKRIEDDNSTNNSFYPGENIEVSLIAYLDGNTTISSNPVIETFNSLYAASDATSLPQKTVYIEYTRHLQNLDADRCMNDKDRLQVVKAIQIGDIDVKAGLDSYLPEDVKFEPIVNEALTNYEGKGNLISNLYIDSQKQLTDAVGLFATFGASGKESTINNVNLVNAKVLISTNNYAGALVGATEGTVEINKVGVYQDDSEFKLSETFINKRAQDDVHITAKNAGGLVGYAGGDLTINNSFASTVITGDELVGGLVGKAMGAITIESSYTDSYLGGTGGQSGSQKATVGGLVADTEDYASIDNVYTNGFTMGFVGKAAGFIPGSITSNGSISAYTAIDYTSASVQIPTVSLVIGGESSDDRLRYVEDYTITSKLESTSPAGIPVNIGNLMNSLDVLGEGNNFELKKKATHPYNYEDLGLMSYQYPTIKGLEHYGDWEDSKYGSLAFFYWEYEQGGDQGYHFYLVKTNQDVISTLCEDYDDGGDITKYGYGYVIKKSEKDNWDVIWDTLTVSADHDGMDTSMTAGLKRVMDPNDHYEICAYRTLDPKYDVLLRSSPIDEGIDIINSLWNHGNLLGALTDEAKQTLFMIGFARCSCTEFRMKNSDTSYFYTFNCFFGRDITLGKVADYYLNNEAKKDIDSKYKIDSSENEGLRTRYIRSIEQLQYINWNCYRYNCHSTPSFTYYRYYPYLQRMGDGLGLIKANFSLMTYEQTHDINAAGFDYTPIAELGVSNAGTALYAFDWFNSAYNGKSHLIRNLNIIQPSYSIGLFGTTVGAKIENVIMISDDGTGIIKKTSGGTSSSKMIGDYYIGGIVGIAADDNFKLIEATVNGADYIKNCAIGGYKIIDETSVNSWETGASCVGGIAGYAGTTIENCSAVVDIYMNTSKSEDVRVRRGKVFVGGIAGTANNGITMNLENIASSGLYRDYSVLNCYSGGSITFGNCKNKQPDTSDQHYYFYVGGILGGNYEVAISNINPGIISSFISYPIKIKNSYTYMELPSKQSGDVIIRIGAIVGGFEYTTRATPNKLDDCYYNKNKVGGVNKYGYIENDENERVIVRYNGTEGDMKAYTSEEMSAIKVNSAQKTYTCQTGKVGNYPFDARVTRNETYIHVGKYPGDPKNSKVTFSNGVSTQAYNEAIINYDGTKVNDSTITTTMEASKLSVANIPTFDSTKCAPFDANEPQGYSRFKGYYYGDYLIVNPDGTFVEDSVLFSNGKWSFDTNEITLTAKFEPINYTITLTGLTQYSELEEDSINPITYNVETETFVLPKAKEAGMRFLGWKGYDVKNPTDFVEIEKGSTGNRIYEAQWANEEYTVEYKNVLPEENNKDNPTKYTIIDLRKGAIELKDATRVGYTFEGWYEKADFSGGRVTKIEFISASSLGNKTFYAKWSNPLEYTATFDANGGTFSDGTNTKNVNYTIASGIVNIPAAPSIGYNFTGWKVTAVGTGDKAGNWALDETDPTTANKYGNVTFTAQYGNVANSYSVMFMPNGGTGNAYTQTGFKYDEEKALASNVNTIKFTKVGYTFIGWSESSSATKQTYTDGQSVKNLTTEANGTKVLYAIWQANSYSVKFMPNGGIGSEYTQTGFKYDEEKALASNVNTIKFTKVGYTFIGWSESSSATKQTYTDGQSVKNLTTEANGTKVLYAVWKVNKYKITFKINAPNQKDVNGNKLDPNLNYSKYANTKEDYSSDVLTYTDTVTIPTRVFTIPGFKTPTTTKYPAWNTHSASEDGVDIYDQATLKTVLEALASKDVKPSYDATNDVYGYTLYGRWYRNKYNLKYNANGGSGSIPDKTDISYTDPFNVSANTFVKTGYHSNGWYYVNDKGTTVYLADNAEVYGLTTKDIEVDGVEKGTVTLYANWVANTYNVNLNLDGGSLPSGTPNPLVKTYGTNLTLPQPTKAHYTFDGWWTGAGGTGTKYTTSLNSDLSTSQGTNVTLYAKWKAIKYKITFNRNYTYRGTPYVGTLNPTTNPVEAEYNSTITLPTLTIEGRTNKSWKDSSGKKYTSTYTVTGDATLDPVFDTSCVISGTMITMFDGTKKVIDDLNVGDLVQTFDHYTGNISSNQIAYIFESTDNNHVIDLYFENDSSISVVNAHGFYEKESNSYVILDYNNADNYIGHSFYNAETGNFVKLVSVDSSVREVKSFSILTAYDINHVANGFLAISDDIDAILSPFEYGSDMKYDAELMKADIEKYGLAKYEDYQAYCTEEEFNVFNGKYLPVSIGKGKITKEELIDWILKYSHKYNRPQSEKNSSIICYNSEAIRNLLKEYEQ